MSRGKRYRFQGTKFQVQTGLGTPIAITGITQADPALVTAPAHGLALGDVVQIAGVQGMVDLNDQVYPIDNPETDDFELAGVDSTGYDAFTADSPNEAAATPVTFSEFCELTGVNQQDGASQEIAAETICSTAREFELGLPDSGTLQLSYNLANVQPVQTALRAARKDGDAIAFRIKFPKDGGTLIMTGLVQQQSFQGQVNGLWTGQTTIKLTGDVFVLEAA